MGLLDILNGISNSSGDPRSAQASQGMSPIAKALLGLLAVYAAKNVTRSAPNQPAGEPGGGLGGSLGDILGSVLGGGRPGAGGGPGGGGLGDVLGSVLGGGRPGAGGGPGGGGGGLGDVLGGLLGGGAAGSALNGGLGDLLKQFQQNGLGDVAHSWVGTGPNKAIAPDDLASALGSDTINALSKQTGLGRDDLLAGLSQHLPGLVDKLTPHGRLPTPEEAAKNL
ncbi:MAG: hypothetical protein QOI40_3664 [Alphaproteobacteria bacterium]|jgi:uncharacterized protein YidB (DUF937 family)|nr:hypothetical protein [Alphaproteobacteria bacterium]